MTRRISSIQQGLIAQYEFVKYVILGSHGLIQIAAPMTDDERRDYEVRLLSKLGIELAVQVKSAMQLHRMSRDARYLYILFDVAPERLVSSPFYYYFFGYLDPKLMRIIDPAFLIPSADFHRLAAPRMRNGVWQFTMAASMDAKSRDKWHPYRVGTLDLGTRLLQILRELPTARTA